MGRASSLKTTVPRNRRQCWTRIWRVCSRYKPHHQQQLPRKDWQRPVQDAGPQVDLGTVGDGHYVVIDVTAKDHDGKALLDQLVGIGLLNGSYFGSMASGLLPVSAIGELATIGDVGFARQSLAISHLASQGSVVTQ